MQHMGHSANMRGWPKSRRKTAVWWVDDTRSRRRASSPRYRPNRDLRLHREIERDGGAIERRRLLALYFVQSANARRRYCLWLKWVMPNQPMDRMWLPPKSDQLLRTALPAWSK